MKELRRPCNLEKCKVLTLYTNIFQFFLQILSCCPQSSKSTKTSFIEMVYLTHEDKDFTCFEARRRLYESIEHADDSVVRFGNKVCFEH